MLFNSYAFLFALFPLSLLAHRLAAGWGLRPALGALLAASLVFYASWDIRHLGLLAASVLANYLVGRSLESAVRGGRPRRADLLLASGVGANLLVLGWFKYANFVAENVNALTGAGIDFAAVVLPLGISFFTFEQIGYLVDLRRGQAYGADLLRYALFVCFFPRLVAGPVLRYDEIAPQLRWQGPEGASGRRPWSEDLAVGLTLFAIGLAKKAVLADGIAPYVNQPFAAAAAGEPVDLVAAWGGALAYTCQLYFDFSGYSDMAIGAARCFGIRFPANFASPYKARSIIEFWRRWHITLSRFLRDYLYIALGGGRRGQLRRYANLVATMVLGGLWHGANWTFVAWGGLHAAYLCANHAWTALRARSPALDRAANLRGAGLLAWALTFLAVVVGWVFFRAPTLQGALNMLAGMAGANGARLPYALEPGLAPAAPALAALGVTFGEGSGTVLVLTWAWISGLLLLALLAPNSQQILGAFAPALDNPAGLRPARWLRWAPNRGWAVAVGVALFLGLASVANRNSEFLYWQF